MCNALIFGVRYKVSFHFLHITLVNIIQCLHPDCPDFDLCERCEAHPMPQHPENHPLLKLKSADTMIPSVLTTQVVGPTLTANEEVTAQEPPVPEESVEMATLDGVSHELKPVE